MAIVVGRNLDELSHDQYKDRLGGDRNTWGPHRQTGS